MTSPLALGAAALIATGLFAGKADAAEAQKSGDWLFNSSAFAETADAVLTACVATTESENGTVFTIRLEPTANKGVEAMALFQNPGWQIDPSPDLVRLDIGARRWIMPASGGGEELGVLLSGGPHLLALLEELSSGSDASLIGRNGASAARFSLSGSRAAIDAMTTCLEEQIGRPLPALFAETGTPNAANPF